jgi:hypothetical protein
MEPQLPILPRTNVLFLLLKEVLALVKEAVARVEEEQLTKSVKPIINLNVFIILAENIRVGIAIADNTIHSSIHRFIDSSIHLKNILNIVPNIKQNI